MTCCNSRCFQLVKSKSGVEEQDILILNAYIESRKIFLHRNRLKVPFYIKLCIMRVRGSKLSIPSLIGYKNSVKKQIFFTLVFLFYSFPFHFRFSQVKGTQLCVFIDPFDGTVIALASRLFFRSF